MLQTDTPAFSDVISATHGAIRALVCDLGNVLLHFDHRLVSRRLALHLPGMQWDEARESAFWPLVHDFERGRIESAEFLSRSAAVLGTAQSLSSEDFRLLWADIFWPNIPLIELLAGLRERMRLVMLSNTNALHIAFARERFPEVFAVFHETVFSYEEGAAKPEEAVFRTALARAGTQPAETLYLDDIAAYVHVAAALGMHAYQYVSLEGVRDVFRLHALIQE